MFSPHKSIKKNPGLFLNLQRSQRFGFHSSSLTEVKVHCQLPDYTVQSCSTFAVSTGVAVTTRNEPPHKNTKDFLQKLLGKTNNRCTCEIKGADQLCSNGSLPLFSLHTWYNSCTTFIAKFQYSSILLLVYMLVYVEPVRKPHRWFSHAQAQVFRPPLPQCRQQHMYGETSSDLLYLRPHH